MKMIKRIYMVFMMIGLLAFLALPVAASEGTGVNLPGWVGGLLAIFALVLPIIVFANLRHRD